MRAPFPNENEEAGSFFENSPAFLTFARCRKISRRRVFFSLYDFHRDLLIGMVPGRFHYDADRFCDSALFSDNLAHVALRDADFKNGNAIFHNFRHGDVVGIVNERFYDE
jgi:hypothetical protein